MTQAFYGVIINKTVKKQKTIFSKQNLFWLGIFLVFLAILSLLFSIFSNGRKPRKVFTHRPEMVVEELDIDSVNDDENLLENLDFQKVHTEFQASYLELVQNITSKEATNDGSGIVKINPKKLGMMYRNYQTAQTNYEKVLKIFEDNEKDYKLKCFARMRKLILAVLYYDKKTGKKLTKFDTDMLVEMGALEEVPICPRGGEYSIIYKNGKRLFNCSVHGVLKN